MESKAISMITIELSPEQCQAILSKASAEDLAFIEKDEGWEDIPEEQAHWRAALSIVQSEMQYQCSKAQATH